MLSTGEIITRDFQIAERITLGCRAMACEQVNGPTFPSDTGEPLRPALPQWADGGNRNICVADRHVFKSPPSKEKKALAIIVKRQ